MTAEPPSFDDSRIIFSPIVAGLAQEQNHPFGLNTKGLVRLKELEIVIAEDSKLLSDLTSRMLSKVQGLNVVGLVADGVSAVNMVRELKPHLLVLDISMPLKDGVTVLEEIRAEDDSTVIVMFTSDQSPLIRKICQDFGANYFLDKSQVTELVEICTLHLLAL